MEPAALLAGYLAGISRVIDAVDKLEKTGDDTVKIALIILAVVLVALSDLGAKFVGVRNDLATQQEAVKRQWSDVEGALQRRSDLIPNLVATVQGFAKHETEVYKDIADARAALAGGRTPQEKMAANEQLSGALARLLVVVENYPQLKRTRTSCICRTNCRGPRTASIPSAASTTRRCRL